MKILQYMIGHNAEHAREMRELAGRLRETGKSEAAELIDTADGMFMTGKESTWMALSGSALLVGRK